MPAQESKELALYNNEGWDKYRINSNSLTDFLVGSEHLPGNPTDFAPQLNLGIFTPPLKDLFNQTQVGYVFDEEVRSQATSSQITSEDPKSQSIWSNIQNQKEAFYNMRAVVERGRTIYYNPDRQYIGASDITHGQFAKVTSNIIDIIDAGNIPILDAHTHPENSFFSIKDFDALLINAYAGNKRLVNGVVVLCPDIQVLALATTQTPVLEPEESRGLIKKWDQRWQDEHEDRQTILFNRSERVENIAWNTQLTDFIKAKEYSLEIIQKIQRGEISEPEVQNLIDDIKTKFELKAGQDLAKFKRVFGKTLARSLSYFSRTTNGLAVEFARSNNIKLYASTDIQHFKEFTA